MNNVIERKWCTKGTVYIEDLTGTAFTGEDGGHTFVISGVNPDGTSVTLAGTVAGAYILPDGSTQPLTGSIADGKAQITLDPECYALPGRGQLTIFLMASGQKVAIYGAVLNVARSSTTQMPPAIAADVADLVQDIEEARASIPASYTDLMASLAKNYADLTFPVTAGTYAWQDGWMYRAKVDIASAESWTAAHWEKVPLADSLVNDLSALKSTFERTAKVVQSLSDDVDLDISDQQGNVIARFKDGRICVKDFDSSSVGDLDNLETENKETIVGAINEVLGVASGYDIFKTSENTEPDLDLSDDNGNVIARFTGGGIQTKQFDGRQYTTFSAHRTFTPGTSLTAVINRGFKKGDRIVLHIERGAMPWEVGALVSYYVGETKITRNNWYGDSVWLEHTVMEDADSVSAVFPSNAYSASTELDFQVSLLGDLPIAPTVVTIKQDGSGDYTNLRDCLMGIGTKANDVLNPYRIEIYPGTYNVLDDYTAEEKANVKMDGSVTSYTNESFVGAKILNGMSLIGMGKPEEVIINGWLPGGTLTDEAAKRLRAQTSALNLQGSCSIENLTVIAENMRYCVHDDFGAGSGKPHKRKVKNCIFRGYAIAYTPCTTYGAGMPSSGMDFEFENCDFGENAGVHTVPGLGYKPTIHLKNCKGLGFTIGDMDAADPITKYSYYCFDNCGFMWIRHSASSGIPHVKVRGKGGRSAFIQADPALDYYTKDTFLVPRLDIAVGKAVEIYTDSNSSGPRFRQTTDVANVYGVVVYKDSEYTYIQIDGYITTDRLGLTGVSLNDYIGLDGSSCAVVQSSADAFGRIVYIDNYGNGYVKIGGKF